MHTGTKSVECLVCGGINFHDSICICNNQWSMPHLLYCQKTWCTRTITNAKSVVLGSFNAYCIDIWGYIEAAIWQAQNSILQEVTCIWTTFRHCPSKSCTDFLALSLSSLWLFAGNWCISILFRLLTKEGNRIMDNANMPICPWIGTNAFESSALVHILMSGTEVLRMKEEQVLNLVHN